ncbi:MAG: type I glyceraldehyde-3-phosphate dehydrogenase [Halanaerobiales bacterium]|nr:type I glyceraldehyde-3-phosphate dehydrogenase [Halanaerobiales bacterium]
MSVKVGINGFGAIGRKALRGAIDNPEIEFVAINDLVDPKVLAYLLKYDSNHGTFKGEIDHTDSSIIVNGKEIKILNKKDPADLPWKDLGVEVVYESTGLFTNANDAKKHLKAGAKKVIISAPAKNEDITLVMGVNDQDYDPGKHNIVSNASCTTNCLAPVAKILDKEFGIEKGLMTTIHSYTSSQNLLDGPYNWKKITRGRAAAENIVPTTTGAAVATTLVLPELEGKLDGMAVRTQTPTGSLVDLVATLETDLTEEDINSMMKKYAEGEMKNILQYNEEPIVSRDIIGNSHSSIFDANYTKVIEGNMVKILSWYDNEWGYAQRLNDLALKMKKLGF